MDSEQLTLKDNQGEYTFRLAAPDNAADRWCITTLAQDNQYFAVFAGLAACWRGPGRPKAKIAQFNHNYARFGKAVLDEMLKRGFERDRLFEVAAQAFILCTDGVIDGEAVEATADFSEAQPGPSTG